MARFVGVNGPRASREEPDRQERQVQPRQRAIRLVHSDTVTVAGPRHLVAGKVTFLRRRLVFPFLTVVCRRRWVVHLYLNLSMRIFIRWSVAHVSNVACVLLISQNRNSIISLH